MHESTIRVKKLLSQKVVLLTSPRNYKSFRGISLSNILEEQVDQKYFLSEKIASRILSYLPSQQDITEDKQTVAISVTSRNKSSEEVKDTGSIKLTESQLHSQVRRGGVGAKTGLYAVGGLQKHQTIRTDEISPTLTQAMGQGGGQTPMVWNEEMKIRRLTPKECERLQGFPDGWTEGVSDTQRYKCLGNAVTTNVIQAIMERLLEDRRIN